MTTRLDFRLYRKGVGQLLRSPQVEQHLRRRAERIADTAGPGHVVDSDIGRTRARAAVITATFAAKRAEATDRNLTRAFLRERQR